MKLFVRRYGRGFPVIILHGLLGISDNWVSLARRLAAGFEVIVPDLRNHGQSPHSPVFTYLSMVNDLEEMIRDLGLSGFSIIGHSLGGKIAMQYALKQPEILDKLVIVDIGPREHIENTEQRELIHAMMRVDFSGIHSRSGIEQQLMDTVKSERIRQFLMKNAYWKDKDHLDWRINLQGILENLAEIFKGVDAEKKYTKPVFFIRGGLSNYVTDKDLQMIHQIFPSAIISTIAKAGHWVHADEPEEFFGLVWDFLTTGESKIK